MSRKKVWRSSQRIADEMVVLAPADRIAEVIRSETARAGGKLFEQVLLDPDSDPTAGLTFRGGYRYEREYNSHLIEMDIIVETSLADGTYRFRGGPLDNQVRAVPPGMRQYRVPVAGTSIEMFERENNPTPQLVPYNTATYEQVSSTDYKEITS